MPDPEPIAQQPTPLPQLAAAVEQEDPDYLEPLREFVEEALADKRRVAALAADTKQNLSKQQTALAEFKPEDPILAALVEAQRASLEVHEVLLAEQSETFSSFLSDLAQLVAKNVEQLRSNDDEIADGLDSLEEELQNAAEEEEGDEDFLPDSVLIENDGNTIAALLYEYQQHLRLGLPNTVEGSPEWQQSSARVQQLEQIIHRVKEITVREEPDEDSAAQSGSEPETEVVAPTPDTPPPS